jgi:hypothetical protein
MVLAAARLITERTTACTVLPPLFLMQWFAEERFGIFLGYAHAAWRTLSPKRCRSTLVGNPAIAASCSMHVSSNLDGIARKI